TEILKALQKIRTPREQYLDLIKKHDEIYELLDLFANDQTELENIKADIYQLVRQIKKFKVALLLSDEQDNSNCFMSINSGAGGTESQDWAEMLLRMYVRFCEREKLQANILDYQVGEGA